MGSICVQWFEVINMSAAVEIVLAFLAAIGFLGLGWLLLGRLLIPAEGVSGIAVVPGKGDGETLEQTVMGFLWLRGGGLFHGTVVIVDYGLSQAGRAVASALALREPNILVCPAGQLGEMLQTL